MLGILLQAHAIVIWLDGHHDCIDLVLVEHDVALLEVLVVLNGVVTVQRKTCQRACHISTLEQSELIVTYFKQHLHHLVNQSLISANVIVIVDIHHPVVIQPLLQ